MVCGIQVRKVKVHIKKNHKEPKDLTEAYPSDPSMDCVDLNHKVEIFQSYKIRLVKVQQVYIPISNIGPLNPMEILEKTYIIEEL